MGSFQELPLEERVHRKGASLLALLQQELGPLPLALAEAQRAPRPARQVPGGLPVEVAETLRVRKGVVELSSLEGAGALTLALRLMAHAQREEPARWLCTIDPAGTLCAPAVASCGVTLERTLVLQPPEGDLLRLSVRVARAGVFSALAVDVTGLGSRQDLVVFVRRLSLAAEDHDATVFLLTSARIQQRQPLPVAVRALVEPGEGGVTLARVLRHRHGRLGTQVVPPPKDELPARFGQLADVPAAPRAGKSQRTPARTHARGHRERQKALPGLLPGSDA